MRALLYAVLLSALVSRPVRAQAVDLALERGTATRLGLGVGDTVRLGPAPDSLVRLGVVRAIYQPRPDPAEIARRALQARFHLPDLAELLGAPDRVDRSGLALAPGVSPDSAAAELNRSAFGFRAYPSAEIASESSQTFQVVSRFHRAIAMITIVASAVFLLCIMLLKVEEHDAEQEDGARHDGDAERSKRFGGDLRRGIARNPNAGGLSSSSCRARPLEPAPGRTDPPDRRPRPARRVGQMEAGLQRAPGDLRGSGTGLVDRAHYSEADERIGRRGGRSVSPTPDPRRSEGASLEREIHHLWTRRERARKAARGGAEEHAWLQSVPVRPSVW